MIKQEAIFKYFLKVIINRDMCARECTQTALNDKAMTAIRAHSWKFK
jgi:hypothetical protein